MPSQKPGLITLIVCIALFTLGACAPVTTKQISDYERKGDLDKLIQVAGSGDKQSRIRAIRALGGLKDPRAINALKKAMQSSSWVERETAVIAIGEINDYLSLKPLIAALADSDQFVRERAAKVLLVVSTNLSKEKSSRVVDILFPALKSTDEYTREQVATALQNAIDELKNNSKPFFLGQLIDRFNQPNRYVRREAVRALGKFNDPRVIRPLLAAQKDPDPQVQIIASEALLHIDNPQSVSTLLVALGSEDGNIREDAIDALKKFTKPNEISEMVKALQNRNPRVREGIISVLGDMHTPDIIQSLVPILKDNAATVRQAAANALQRLAWLPDSADDKAINCVALQDWGNCGQYADAAIKPLLFAMHDSVPEIRNSAAAVLTTLKWAPASDDEKGIDCVMRQNWDECIKLGKPALGALIRELNIQDTKTKQAVINTLAKINDISAIQPLVFSLNTDDASVRISVVNALGQFNHPLAIKTLLHTLDDSNYYVRQAALTALENNTKAFGKNSLFDVRTPLLNALKDNNRNVRLAAAKLLGVLQDPQTIDALIEGMLDQDREVRVMAADSMARIKSSDAIPSLVKALKNKHPEIRIRVLRALAEFKDNRATEPLLDTVNDKNEAVQLEAVRILGEIDDPRTVTPLIKMLSSENINIQNQAIIALGNKNDPLIISYLKSFLNNDNGTIREAAGQSLIKLKWKPLTKDEEGNYCVISHDWLGCEALGKYAVSALITELRDPESKIRNDSARTLGVINDKRAIEPLINSIESTRWSGNKDDNKVLLETVTKALAKFGSDAIPELMKHMSEWYTGHYVAQALASLGWIPKSDIQVVHFQVALRNKSKLLSNWAVTKKILLKDISSLDDQVRNTALFALIGLGKTETINPMKKALENKGTVTIAEAYLNSGNEQLEASARSWTGDHNLEVKKYSKGNNPVSWGGM